MLCTGTKRLQVIRMRRRKGQDEKGQTHVPASSYRFSTVGGCPCLNWAMGVGKSVTVHEQGGREPRGFHPRCEKSEGFLSAGGRNSEGMQSLAISRAPSGDGLEGCYVGHGQI